MAVEQHHLQSLPRILLVEDDEALAALVARHLTDSQFCVSRVGNTAEASQKLADESWDLLVLDVMLPGEDGLSFCRRLRREADVAIIMVTARGQEADRVRGLELGADDYLPKPFSLWELEARIRAVLRRSTRAISISASSLRTAGPVTLDLGQRTVTVAGQRVELTRTEFDLLEKLTGGAGRVFSREQLLSCVQGRDTDSFDRAVDTHITNLRRKIEADPKNPVLLKTVWGIGYRFEYA